jgi:hypothetical protein
LKDFGQSLFKMHKLLAIVSLAIFAGQAAAQQQEWGQC